MSSLHVINKGTKTKPGAGLPFYDKIDYVFSNWNNGFNDTLGLWEVPTGKIPTFQIWLPRTHFISLVYRETKGGNNFTGVTFTPAITITPKGVVHSELGQLYIFEWVDNGGTLIVQPPASRWILELKVANGDLNPLFKYSEEFITTNC